MQRGLPSAVCAAFQQAWVDSCLVLPPPGVGGTSGNRLKDVTPVYLRKVSGTAQRGRATDRPTGGIRTCVAVLNFQVKVKMSITLTKTGGVSVLTMTSDPTSFCPPLCQIFKVLCYSPACCSVSEKLKTVGGSSQSALGTIQIMDGLFNIALGAILYSSGGTGWQMDMYFFPYWLGGLFILFGIMCILSERFPSPCTVSLNVMMNLAGVPFAIAAIVLYAVSLADAGVWWMCSSDSDSSWYEHSYWTNVAPSTTDGPLQERCEEGKMLIEHIQDAEYCQPLLEEVTANPIV
ncbi:uncharacterized protein LOC130117986 isoform X2 [Lampris incognitus]|uniref:uncharacterized protein LOC130117986 isoform X2 n=1 Tax=Lampris incognitus TaxID=2546036 RepID=UPI0024B54D86|nr:uncharacterized protein LOC130117986 isoform X2 [Lampris incognitus]